MKKTIKLILATLLIFGSVVIKSQSTVNSYTSSLRFLNSDFLQMYQAARFSIPTFTGSTVNSYTSTLKFQNSDNLQMYQVLRGIASSSIDPTGFWSITGNTLSPDGTNYLGTNNDFNLIIKRNSIEKFIVKGSETTFGLNNVYCNNYRARKTNVASSNSVTVLTKFSARVQQLTGSATHTFNLPNATTLDTNFTFEFNNNSTGILTVANTSSTSLYNVPAGGYARVMNQNINTPNDTWDCHYLLPANANFGTNATVLTGSITIGTGTVAVNTTSLGILRVKQGSSWIDFGEGGTFPFISINQTSPNYNNSAIWGNSSTTYLNATSAVNVSINGSQRMSINTSGASLTGAMSISGTSTLTGNVTAQARIVANQGTDVASAVGSITLAADGNYFEITGTSAITRIANLLWKNGSEVTLLFTSTASLTDGTANSSTDIGFELAGNTNFTATADDLITLVLTEIGGTQRWREKCRSIN